MITLAVEAGATKTAGTGITVTVTGLTTSGASAAYYVLSPTATTTANITAAAAP